MSALSGQLAKVLRVEDATLHVAPTAAGYELLIVTDDGVQVAVNLDLGQLAAVADEARDVLTGAPIHFHAAGVRLTKRLEQIKGPKKP